MHVFFSLSFQASFCLKCFLTLFLCTSLWKYSSFQLKTSWHVHSDLNWFLIPQSWFFKHFLSHLLWLLCSSVIIYRHLCKQKYFREVKMCSKKNSNFYMTKYLHPWSRSWICHWGLKCIYIDSLGTKLTVYSFVRLFLVFLVWYILGFFGTFDIYSWMYWFAATWKLLHQTFDMLSSLELKITRLI
jgi:hypothetical protein